MRFFQEIKKYGNFAKYAAKSDLRAEVANSYLNWLWWIIEPLSSMLVYAVVFGFILKNDQENFPIFIFLGITVWEYFSRCITSSVSLIRVNNHIISRVYMPKHILLVQRMLVLMFKMLINWGIVTIMLLIYKVPIGINILYIFPISIVFFVFCFGVSLFFMHFGVYVSDLTNLVAIALNLMFYITGIFYSIQDLFPAPIGYLLQRVNPVAYFIFCYRKAILYNEHPSDVMLIVWLIISVILTAIGLKLVYKNENNYVKMT